MTNNFQIDSITIKEALSILRSNREVIPAIKSKNLIKAAVLVLFVKKNDIWHLLYTKRSDNLPVHQGQVSFPGGRMEPDDRDTIATALREAYEEVGAPYNSVEIIGTMPELVTVSGFLLTPVIGIMDWPVNLIPAISEVSKILLIPVHWLSDKNNWRINELKLSGKKIRKIISYDLFEGERLWGITADITVQLFQMMENCKKP